jgi:hypothetical protein
LIVAAGSPRPFRAFLPWFPETLRYRARITLKPPVDIGSSLVMAETKFGLASPLYSRAWNVMIVFLR